MDSQRECDERARRLNAEGCALLDEGRLEEAEARFRRSLQSDPGFAQAWFNLGLMYKQQRRWPESLRCSLRAAELDPEDQAGWWNLGIAATALRDWATARRAWRGCGVTLLNGDGPPLADFGLACVRLNPRDDAEVVWCRRLDPARARIASVPLPLSGHRWGDVVLHDGAPAGERLAHGHTYPVFDELERWESSATPTLRVEVEAPSPGDADALVNTFDARGLAAEDWTASVRSLCKHCSEGRPHEHTGSAPEGWQVARLFGLAAGPEQAAELLAHWAGAGAGRRYDALEEMAADTDSAV